MANPPAGISRALGSDAQGAPPVGAAEAGRLARAFSVEDVEAIARECLGAAEVAAVDAVAGTGAAARANRRAFLRHVFLPRVLVDVGSIDCRTRVLGHDVSAPILLAPVARLGRFHPDGELAAARAARTAGTMLCVAADASVPVQDLGETADRTWVQVDGLDDRERARDLVARGEAAGCRAIVLGGGASVGREPARRLSGSRWSVAPPREAGSSTSTGTGWGSIEWLRGITTLPLVLKGVLTAEDARLAAEHGASGVIVSNDGGRDLDESIATLDALPEVVDASDGRLEVYLDGGVRRGSDVAIALALGARAVLVGRQLAWGLAAGGEAGVVRTLELMRGELRSIMGNAGAPTIDRIGRGLVS